MLNAFASLKCSKKCQHNVQKPNHKHSFIMRPGLQTRSKYRYAKLQIVLDKSLFLSSLWFSNASQIFVLSLTHKNPMSPLKQPEIIRSPYYPFMSLTSQRSQKKITPDLRLPLKRLRLQKLDRAYATSIHNIVN